MSSTDRLVEAFRRAPFSEAVRNRILAVFTPETFVAAIVSFVVVFAVAQVTPVGWAADFALLLTAAFVGAAIIRAAEHLITSADARTATTEEQLDHAGRALAAAFAEVGVDAVLVLLTRRLAPAARPGGGAPPPPGPVFMMQMGDQMALVAVNTVPLQVAARAGVTGVAMMSMSGGGGGGDRPPDDDGRTAAERDWDRAQEQADRQQGASDQPTTTEHGAIRQQQRGALTAAEQARLGQEMARVQPDGASVRLLSEGGGTYTVVVTNAEGVNVTVIRGKTRAELRGLSRNYGWFPPYN